MSATPDNPPAFPCPDMGREHFDKAGSYPGMSLRDWFAGQATEADINELIPKTTGECAAQFHALGFGPKPTPQDSGRYMIQHGVSLTLRYWAKYKHADMMLAARSGASTARDQT